jgi:uncharacterized protein (TIGR02271 family)
MSKVKQKVSHPVNSGQTQVTTRDGITGVCDVNATRSVDGEPHVVVTLQGGRQVLVPAALLVAQPDGTYSLPMDAATLQDKMTIPVVVEELDVHKRKVTTAHVRVVKRVHRREQVVDEPIVSETVEVQRVPINQPVEQLPEVRQEGDTTIIPVLEERLIVTKQLVLVEEVHVIRRRHERHEPQTVTLAREQVDIERVYSKT